MNDSLLLEEMNWPDVGTAIEEGWTTAVVAVAAIEQGYKEADEYPIGNAPRSRRACSRT